ncbi:TATA-binding protein-associated factor 172 isoform X2 [Plutella xylostella]|uniref:TATA-binding protein-associated factor 172 isoform X2 n=1 Tax=Plutella xylostella TaxID=51655 RepID=UPI0020330069|nr:TATA-binding protein-associated factor 172 isoform X2 [Plutella xylostella]
MTSRLDRLFVLLEAGSGAGTRRAAARQLGEVQRAHPEELHRLLARLMKHLKSPAWDTRVAAAQAVEAILENVPEWKPPPLLGIKEEKAEPEEPCARLRCETFDIERVLQNGAHLMGSEGHEYDLDEESLTAADTKERLAKQRQQLNARLGLDVASSLGVDLSGVYTNEDLCCPVTPQTTKEPVRRSIPVQELVSTPCCKPLSSREMNVAKRRARQAALSKQKSREAEDTPPPPDRKKLKLEIQDDFLADPSAPTPDCDGTWGSAPSWPLESFSLALQGALFSGAWEARHGAASALRELLRANVCRSAGCKAGDDAEQMEEHHQEWLEDLALRLICVLALDRFGDFVSDQVVAPVRETCAQTLGVALSKLRAGRVSHCARLLSQLSRHWQWEARHGALLGFKYLIAARQEIALESGALEHLITGLGDMAEDVSAVAAGALVPAAAALAEARPNALKDVVNRLWQLLHEQDDLASPANSYMALLAALMTHPQAAKQLHPIDLADVLPRMWPYLDHSTSSVRKATLQTLRTLTRPLVTEPKETQPQPAENTAENGVEYLVWTPELLQEAMRYIYQRILFEHVHDIQDIAVQVWMNLVRHAPLGTALLAACPMLARWLCLAMQPARIAVDTDLLLQPPTKERRVRPTLQGDALPPEVRPTAKLYLGGAESQPAAVRERNVTRARCTAADVLGYLSCYLVQPAPGIEYKSEDESPIDCYVKVLIVYLRSGSALQRLVASLVISSWARHTLKENMFPPSLANLTNGASTNGSASSQSDKEGSSNEDSAKEMAISRLAPPLLVNTLHAALNQALYYDEVALNCNRILQEARDLLAMMKHYKLPVDGEEFNNILRLEQVIHMTTVTKPMVAAIKLRRVQTSLEERRVKLHADVNQCALEQATLNVSVQAALAGAATHLHSLPEKLNPVARPLMESIKRECSQELQREAAGALAVLLQQAARRDASPNAKILVNLKAFLRCDPDFTPRINLTDAGEESSTGDSGSGDSGGEGKAEATHSGPAMDKYSGILTLYEQQREAEKVSPRRGRPPAVSDMGVDAALLMEDESQKQHRIQRRGATLALTSLTAHFGASLPERLPRLWEFISQPFLTVMGDQELDSQEAEAAEELVSRLQVFEVVCAHVGDTLWTHIAHGVSSLAALTRHRFTAVRHMAARALAAFACRQPTPAMNVVVHELLPTLESVQSARARCGAAEALARVVEALKLRAVPYIVLLLVPLLGRMSDQCEPVRVMATRCFASLIQLMPLDGAVPEPDDLSLELQARRAHDKKFIEQLFNPKSIKDYKIPVAVSAELRGYQQAGVNWLRFLNEYKLHGVLCDDMGLGKTLQSIVVVAGSHYERARDYARSGAADRAPLPSLVVCPPTLTGHWVFEVNKFIPTKYLKPLQYVGPPFERERLRTQVKHYNLIVASYDIVRKDIDFFSSLKWNYCVLDEGHVIKNVKTKAFKAIKQIVANHRLILSGTPIQNNVVELWSLFEFLMPGLLGTERQFSAEYARPILAARDPRAPAKAVTHAARASQALHRQVLPFLLRRVKEDVLKELPPKITQDYYCELSPLQKQLYEDFSKAHMPNGMAQQTHVFQALHYLQNVCNHPKLVLTSAHPEARRVAQRLADQRSSLDDIEHSAKLPALKQLLLDCGIGAAPGGDTEVVVSQHRALIFCQLKKMLDIVENDLLKKHLPTVSYLRLDGSVPPANRHSIVTRFNNDPSIDLLLLTTAVGGLGLNLTGADTVIFVEHDWNPMKDAQAMDRAHRIGQRKVVNVYRLITRDTLEQKIMCLQKFKLQTANTVISSENAAMETMGTEQLLDLFQLSSGGAGAGAGSAGGAGPSQSALEALPDLWDDRQYEEEYDMTNFIKGLNKMN